MTGQDRNSDGCSFFFHPRLFFFFRKNVDAICRDEVVSRARAESNTLHTDWVLIKSLLHRAGTINPWELYVDTPVEWQSDRPLLPPLPHHHHLHPSRIILPGQSETRRVSCGTTDIRNTLDVLPFDSLPGHVLNLPWFQKGAQGSRLEVFRRGGSLIAGCSDRIRTLFFLIPRGAAPSAAAGLHSHDTSNFKPGPEKHVPSSKANADVLSKLLLPWLLKPRNKCFPYQKVYQKSERATLYTGDANPTYSLGKIGSTS